MVCLYLDLDGFKAINDAHGHQVGDELLKIAATRLTLIVGNSGTIARLGGDEFVILAPAHSPEQGHALGARIVREIGGAPYRIGGSEALRIGVSVGFACAPEDGRKQADLARKADAALYAAKSAGKHTQRRYSPGQCASGYEREMVAVG